MSLTSSQSPRPLIAISCKAAIAIFVVPLVVVLWLVWPFMTGRGPVRDNDIDEHFRYASIGGEDSDSIPYWIELIETYLNTLSASRYPCPMEPSKVKQGAVIFEKNCASCHTSESERVMTEIPLTEINTDPYRLNHWTQATTDGMNQVIGRYVEGGAQLIS